MSFIFWRRKKEHAEETSISILTCFAPISQHFFDQFCAEKHGSFAAETLAP
jgi:hypothetical protein